MNDEQRLEAWFSDREEAPDSVQRGVGRVMSEVPKTRQQGRWLLLPIHRPKAQTPTATDTAEYQPSPIPASNGHTPTVIGRTTSMLSPVKAITAGAIIFAIGGVMLIAQPFGQQISVPGAEGDEATTEPTTPAVVTGNMMGQGDVAQEPTNTEVDGVNQTRGLAFEGERLEMDDPRLTGTVSYEINADGRTVGDTESALLSVHWRIENEEGSWSGSCPSLFIAEQDADPSTMDPYIFSCLYTGAGAYEGLNAFLVQENPAEPPYPVKGLIFEGDMPPMPELPSAE
jgi:hypothetical protein